jgi:curli biogenesis system outer membrane secretion channel CsgG
MKRHTAAIAALALALSLPLGALAADAAASASKVEAPKAKPVEKLCDPPTSSRVRKSKTEECPKGAKQMSTYTQEDLQSTGETDTVEALRKLDPRFH